MWLMETSVDDFTTALPVAAVGSTVRYSQKPGGHRPKHTVVFLEERARAQTVQRDFENQAGSKRSCSREWGKKRWTDVLAAWCISRNSTKKSGFSSFRYRLPAYWCKYWLLGLVKHHKLKLCSQKAEYSILSILLTREPFMQDAFMSTKTARRHNTRLEMHCLGMHNISVTRFFHAIGIVQNWNICIFISFIFTFRL